MLKQDNKRVGGSLFFNLVVFFPGGQPCLIRASCEQSALVSTWFSCPVKEQVCGRGFPSVWPLYLVPGQCLL